MNKWRVQTHGGPNEKLFEISVINPYDKAFFDAQNHYGWFNKNKRLISHNPGSGNWTVTDSVWDKLVKVAQQTADELNEL